MINLFNALRRRLGRLWWYTLLMFVASRMGDVIGLVIALFLVPMFVSTERLGAILPLIQFSALIAIPMTIVTQTALKYLSQFVVVGEKGKIKRLLCDLALYTAGLSAAILVGLGISRGFISERLKLEDPAIVWLVGGLAIVSCWMPVVHAAARALQLFNRIVLTKLVGPAVRLGGILLLLRPLQIAGYLASFLVANLAVVVFLAWGLRAHVGRSIRSVSYLAERVDMLRYMVPVGTAMFLCALQLAVEPWVIRQRLPEMESAGYYIVAMFGSVNMYVASAMIPFLFPLVSERFERGQSTRKMHLQSLGAVLLIGGAVAGCFLIGGRFLLGLHPAWRPYADFAPYIWQIALITTLHVFINCHLQHEYAVRRTDYLKYYVPTVLVEIVVLYGLNLWAYAQPHVSPATWAFVETHAVRSLPFTVGVMLAVRLVVALGVILDCLRRSPERPLQ